MLDADDLKAIAMLLDEALKQHGFEKNPSPGAMRTRRYRERKASQNVTLKTPKRHTPKATPSQIVTKPNGFALPDWIPAMQWEAWVESRTKVKKPPTEFAKKLAVTKLEHLKIQGHAPAAVLAQSAFHCWPGLYPIKEPQR